MFQGKRLITRGVADAIPLEIQMLLWTLLDDLIAKRATETDYLQVFELSGKDGKQTIVHRQEEPLYRAVYQFVKVENPLQFKIYVIDDIGCCTMLLCNEY